MGTAPNICDLDIDEANDDAEYPADSPPRLD